MTTDADPRVPEPESPHEYEAGPQGKPTTPPAAQTPAQPASAQGAFAEGMAQAARRAGFTSADEGQTINGQSLMLAMGGIRGLVEAVLPGLVFLVTYTLTQDLVPALIAPVVIGLIFTALRLRRKETLTQAIGGLAGIGISAALVLLTGKAEDFYVPGFYTNGIYAVVLLASVIVRWPLIGLAVGFLMGDGVEWRKNAAKRRVLTVLTLCWAGLFIARLAVQLPLYFAENVELLGIMRLTMGVPLYAPLLVVSWLLVRAVYRKADAAT